ncbi:hypothetical protein SMJ63A_10459 [Stenotrophomonas geniculata]
MQFIEIFGLARDTSDCINEVNYVVGSEFLCNNISLFGVIDK